MSKYVKHKHGLVIGSDNEFFVIDEGEKHHPSLLLPENVKHFRDGYKSILSFESYKFKVISTLNVKIRTPAQQLFWIEDKIEWEEEHKFKDDEKMILPFSATYPVLQHWAEKWLNENVGPKYDQWDTYTRPIRDSNPTIFFKKRSSALFVVKKIVDILDGINI